MSKTFRAWDVDQAWLLPPSVHDFVLAGHPAHLVRDVVRESLDLSAILSVYGEQRGQPPYHPAMMVALLLYAYSVGVYSSRRIAKACEERVAFMAVTGMQRPDFRTISDFRKRHLGALAGLFAQVLRLCRRAGLVKLGHVALDGTKIKANASKHKAMSYGRMVKAEARLEGEIKSWFDQAAAADAADDEALGPEARGDEMPPWVANKEKRLARIREAKAALEAEAKAAGEATRAAQAEAPKRPGPKPKPPSEMPADKAQRNFTDPESRVLKTKDGFIQGYNAQAAVDAAHQIIVGHGLTNSPSDQGQFEPVIDAIESHLGARPKEVSADAGHCSEANLEAADARGIRPYIATGRQKHGHAAAVGARPAGSRRWRPPSSAPGTARATACASRPSSRCSARSSRPEASASSCCAAATRSRANGR